MKDGRYQFQPWYVKAWRHLRHSWKIPFYAVSFYWHECRRDLEDGRDWRLSFKQCWGTSKGLRDCHINHVYDWPKVMEDEEIPYGEIHFKNGVKVVGKIVNIGEDGE